MFALLYSSKAITLFNNKELEELCIISSKNNHRIDVTGYLYYRQGNFFQYLEGERHVVMDLMNIIKEDKRHKIKKIMFDETIVGRRFPDWSMRYISLDNVEFEDVIQCRMELLRFSNLDDEAKSKMWGAMDRLSKLREIFE